MEEKASGLILRVRPFTETSLVVNWLTTNSGRISTLAKGARRPKSLFLGKLDLYYQCDFTFQRSRRSDLHILREVALQNTNTELRRDIHALSLAGYAGTLIELATETETALPQVFDLFSEYLHALLSRPPSPALLYAFETRLLANLGHGPNFEHPSLGPIVRQVIPKLATSAFSEPLGLTLSASAARELHSFLFRSMEQAYGRVPQQREKALHSLKSERR